MDKERKLTWYHNGKCSRKEIIFLNGTEMICLKLIKIHPFDIPDEMLRSSHNDFKLQYVYKCDFSGLQGYPYP